MYLHLSSHKTKIMILCIESFYICAINPFSNTVRQKTGTCLMIANHLHDGKEEKKTIYIGSVRDCVFLLVLGLHYIFVTIENNFSNAVNV